MSQRAFVLHAKDNVATALDDLEPGPVALFGESQKKEVVCVEAVKFGHKVALADLDPGDEVLKNQVVIAKAYQAIQAGQWVHLHNIESQFDERAGTLDHDTGRPTDDTYQ